MGLIPSGTGDVLCPAWQPAAWPHATPVPSTTDNHHEDDDHGHRRREECTLLHSTPKAHPTNLHPLRLESMT